MQLLSTDPCVLAYLRRLGIDFLPGNDPLALVQELHRRHSLMVPFGNLDILLGKPPSLHCDALFQKIVSRHRGGYCYELNGLLYFILQKLGYNVRLLSARILFGVQGLFARGHKLLLVEVHGQRFIADVGYRNGLVGLLPFVLNEAQPQESETFRLTAVDDEGFVLQKVIKREWDNLYSFTPDVQLPVDFEPHNFYNSLSPDSIFTQMRIASLKTKEGSVSLLNNVLVEMKNGKRTETPVASSKSTVTVASIPVWHTPNGERGGLPVQNNGMKPAFGCCNTLAG